jgi:hypothetical protein
MLELHFVPMKANGRRYVQLAHPPNGGGGAPAPALLIHR